ncbi:glucose 1-dehydrogenase/3-oxoacyl-[acyl-carrier protein] reductase [Streptosporangium becharense]|uniref:Glucose 1-dehydrogenase/3-oxoacyl-[acyl-carrier protein] reductase n=1 Tax=Streptosporangium becharense TaxID=1816182 RepID=A0A7W9IMF6_9ACTN|nr:SDR family NAD(P)-dependent oxidoreductase [Streptosporangium becharense]MBB2914583.1 glucose 1-dehydrogenase/3-oxoacyl-[acyl-carrier protein] reductase [Streptosporangium becharense]MBB5823428.1 glucose 1-dehydrogenase/3-oxoacyl-[acyl-carrier protein] reductase [Streptosporangium becharense]
MTDRHSGRTALVTGAGSGIGRGIARRLAAEGAQVACVDLKHDLADETVSLITAEGGRALALSADVRDRAEISAALEATVETFGGLDYLVNNAGLVTMSSLEELTDEEWDLVLDVNLKGVYIVTQLALPYLKDSPGAAVVNLSTVEAEVVVSSQGFCQVHYNASKGGVKMLTKALAVELSRYDIRVNCVAPGPVATNFIPGADLDAPEVMEFLGQRLLVKRLAQPEDIAAAASFLLSGDASFITGVQLPVDGGWLTR